MTRDMLGPGAGSARIAGVIDELDDTIAQIRTTIFAIQQTAAPTRNASGPGS